jgi:tRNA A-37 threonylcarbamoyl transferase component Bud32
MEYFEDFEAVNLSKASVRLAEVMGQTLEMIHGTGVVHGDIAERNILLVRENGMVRVVWIDFSCAWAGRQYLDTATDMEWNKFRDLLDKGMVLSFSL